MAKSKSSAETKNVAGASKLRGVKTGLSDLQSDPDLWYKIKVLLHDLSNIRNDPAAEDRTLCTTDALYISGPYFTPEEATLIKATTIPRPSLHEMPEFEVLEAIEELALQDSPSETSTVQESTTAPAVDNLVTVEEAITSCFQNFFSKRRASGDARPCGPHDMAPIYRAVFGIPAEALKDEKSLGRLRRAGLPQEKEKAGVEGKERSGSRDKKMKKKGKEA
ncbi:hypothetical protein B0O99DRAFT_594223 [Bisporella sp. PMI_857]|nr:hypothetical protein B0O99DRAFT_594223 [Bisporella sp. PMI_857]